MLQLSMDPMSDLKSEAQRESVSQPNFCYSGQ